MKHTPAQGADWRAKYYPEETHVSVAMMSEHDAFLFLYRKVPVQMALAQLMQFEGKYSHRFGDGEDRYLDVTDKANFLFIKESWRTVQMQFSPIGDQKLLFALGQISNTVQLE